MADRIPTPRPLDEVRAQRDAMRPLLDEYGSSPAGRTLAAAIEALGWVLGEESGSTTRLYEQYRRLAEQRGRNFLEEYQAEPPRRRPRR